MVSDREFVVGHLLKWSELIKLMRLIRLMKVDEVNEG
jgi:hypothetical protein